MFAGFFLRKENYVCNKAVCADFPLAASLYLKKGGKKFSSTACICLCFVSQNLLMPQFLSFSLGSFHTLLFCFLFTVKNNKLLILFLRCLNQHKKTKKVFSWLFITKTNKTLLNVTFTIWRDYLNKLLFARGFGQSVLVSENFFFCWALTWKLELLETPQDLLKVTQLIFSLIPQKDTIQSNFPTLMQLGQDYHKS